MYCIIFFLSDHLRIPQQHNSYSCKQLILLCQEEEKKFDGLMNLRGFNAMWHCSRLIVEVSAATFTSLTCLILKRAQIRVYVRGDESDPDSLLHWDTVPTWQFRGTEGTANMHISAASQASVKRKGQEDVQMRLLQHYLIKGHFNQSIHIQNKNKEFI